jgi:D-glycero-alpha-D-manno-heptose-7-phosphate kinase
VLYQSVLSVAPLRLSFVGGGSDIPNFYKSYGGAVVSAAIDKYVYVHIKRHDPLFQERYRISYSEVEHTQHRAEIKNKIVRACLEKLEIDEPLQISTSADLPSNSGLGSSSSFAVALLLGLHALRGEEVSPIQVAEEACDVEMNYLSSPIGKQDQYAAAFGGLNHFHFKKDGRVLIEPLNISKSNAQKLFEKSVLIWSGQTREAGGILEDQSRRSEKNSGNLAEISNLAEVFKDQLIKDELDLLEIGKLISNGWKLKKELSPKISTPEVSEIVSKLERTDCYGYKLLGAGGGGFVYALIDNIAILDSIAFQTLRILHPQLDQIGARVVSVK